MTDQKSEVKELQPLKREFSEVSKVNSEYSADQKAFIKSTLAPTLLDNELLLFIYRAQKLGLNPLEGEIFAYASKETINGVEQRKMVVIVARDGKLRFAFKTKHLKSIKTEAIYIKKIKTVKYKTEEVSGSITPALEAIPGSEEESTIRVKPWEGGTLWGAECTIIRDDYETPFVSTVPLAEYKKSTTIWTYKPETMIKKVAESQCLSAAFPELSGVYDESERFDDTSESGQSLKVDGAGDPATESQLETIRALGGSVIDSMTKQEAAETIKKLTRKGK